MFSKAMRNLPSRSIHLLTMLVLVSVLGGALSSPSAAQASAHSPPGQLLVVATNLLEAWGDEANNNSEMDIYVSRLLNQVPYLPDVLLLQEVKYRSARYVKNLLTRETG